MSEYHSPQNVSYEATSSSAVPAKPTKAKLQQPPSTAQGTGSCAVLPQRVGKFGKRRVYQDALVPQEIPESVVEKDVAEEGF